MIIGVGVDIVDVPRFKRSLTRTPALIERLFAQSERVLSLRSLAARFAAKEALVKAVGDPTGFRWHDVEIVSDGHGKPSFLLAGAAASSVEAHGIEVLHLSMSHDGDSACAFVVAEGAAVPSSAADVAAVPSSAADVAAVEKAPDARGRR